MMLSGCGNDALTSRDAVTDTTTPRTESIPRMIAPTPTTGTVVDESLPATTDPTAIEWLAFSSPPGGLRLIRAERILANDCGNGDCAATLPSASLTYDTNDLTFRRSLSIVQFAPSVTQVPRPPLIADEEQRVLGGRAVMAYDGSDGVIPAVLAEWTEPGGNTVQLSATGFAWEAVDALVSSLTPTDPDLWPIAEVQERLGRCVDSRSQYAPTVVPDGWVRFVLQIQPTGTCEVQPFLFMSLVEPGTEVAPGTLVSITVTPVTESTPQPGSLVSVNGHDANLQSQTGPDGQPSSQISFTIDTVAIDVHGNVDGDTLQRIAATIGRVDDAQWAQLVAEQQTPH